MTDLMKKTLDFLSEYTTIDESVTRDSQLIADLELNSLTMMEIANDAEDRFNIIISDEDLRGIVTVGDIVDLLERNGVK